VFDVSDEEAVIGAAVPLMMQATSEFRRQIEVNLITPFVVTKAFAPLLGAREGPPPARGQIVNISSVGGRIGARLLGAYAVSKHGLEGISASLRREMTLYGVDVILVRPGFVAKPSWTKPRQ
jgi:NAD(P)-dependent dehydrogenase (short-subunit alcohol dehydrogenase family)